MGIKGYKVFESDWSCRGYQYEVGKTFKHEGNIEMCGSGFHFCQRASDCFNYYNFNSNNKVARVEAIGLVETKGDKSVTDEIVIVEEIAWKDLLDIVNEGKDNTGKDNTGDWNTGDWNTGDWNTGDCNTGNRNTGDWNTGDWNTGNRNTGDWNTGDWNTGNRNTGNRNTGDWNTGDCNTGDWNTGDWNTGNWNTGVFCTETPRLKLFNKETDLEYSWWFNSKAGNILKWNSELTVWIYEVNMTDKEKERHPEHKTTGGYLKIFTFKEMCENMWSNLTDEEKQIIMDLPNFDAAIFKEITGIDVKEVPNE